LLEELLGHADIGELDFIFIRGRDERAQVINLLVERAGGIDVLERLIQLGFEREGVIGVPE
jgi:hypothetical protein